MCGVGSDKYQAIGQANDNSTGLGAAAVGGGTMLTSRPNPGVGTVLTSVRQNTTATGGGGGGRQRAPNMQR